MSGSTPADRRARATVRRFASVTEADRHDLEYWRAIPEDERVLEVWRLSEEVDFIGRADFIRNKRQTGRLEDLADIEGLDWHGMSVAAPPVN
jgi:hypothetical protein